MIYASACRGSRSTTGISLGQAIETGMLPFIVRRHRQAARRRRGVPGRVVGGRPAAERPLTDPRPSELAGLYGPSSEAWRLNREAALLLGAGPRALLLQVAHPLVAEGVDQHSDFRADPWGRLAGTLRSYLRIVYGTTPAARAEIRAPQPPPRPRDRAGT